VALVDAFNLPDSILCSPFGASDGDVYNRYLQLVKSSPGNNNTSPFILLPFELTQSLKLRKCQQGSLVGHAGEAIAAQT